MVNVLFTPTLFFVATAGALLAQAASIPAAIPEWIAPGPGDVRGPCPMMNSLANHGLIPRSGRNITNKQYLDGLKQVSCGVDLAGVFLTGAAVLGVPHRADGSFGLDDLRKHSTIEHDASLTRNDFNLSPEHDNWTFNQTLYDQMRAFANTDGFLDIHSMALARLNRQKDSALRNPGNDVGVRQGLIAHGEAAVLLEFFGWQQSKVNNKVPLAYADSLFQNERFPYHLGWAPPPIPVTVAQTSFVNSLIIAEEVKIAGPFPPGGL
ncbi:hypothetical protein HDU88_006352 [Geranomyces variabilis]|nr:hypothetical protein HDU88_006352 [Geranomyces variabilis]